MTDHLDAAARFADPAKQSPRGLPMEHFVPAALVTIPTDKVTGSA